MLPIWVESMQALAPRGNGTVRCYIILLLFNVAPDAVVMGSAPLLSLAYPIECERDRISVCVCGLDCTSHGELVVPKLPSRDTKG
jgi:hypothetical protein